MSCSFVSSLVGLVFGLVSGCVVLWLLVKFCFILFLVLVGFHDMDICFTILEQLCLFWGFVVLFFIYVVIHLNYLLWGAQESFVSLFLVKEVIISFGCGFHGGCCCV